MHCSSAISKGFLSRVCWKPGLKDTRENLDLTFIVTGDNPSLVLEDGFGQKRAADPCQMSRWCAAAMI